eukprot:7015597-Alexandrium_andersonii.AAC.1
MPLPPSGSRPARRARWPSLHMCARDTTRTLTCSARCAALWCRLSWSHLASVDSGRQWKAAACPAPD